MVPALTAVTTVVADTVGEYGSSNLVGSTIANGGTWYEEPEPPPPVETEEELRLRWLCCIGAEGGGGGEAIEAEEGEIEEMGFATELKLGQVPRLRCSEAVRDGFEAEKTASHKEHLSLTALGRPVSVL